MKAEREDRRESGAWEIPTVEDAPQALLQKVYL